MYLKATGREAIADAAEHVAAAPAPRRWRAVRPTGGDRPRPAEADDQRAALARPRPPRRRRRRRGGRARTTGRSRSRRRSSARAPTRRTRTSPAPPRSPARPRPRDCAPRPSCSSRPGPSRSGPRSSATACSPTSRRSAPPCWPTPAGRASASGRDPRASPGSPNTIVNSYNRNFPKRNDGSANTLSFVTSPDTVMALALAGRLDFDPTHRHADGARRQPRSRSTPPVGEVLPDQRLRPRRRHVHRAAGRRLGRRSWWSSPDSDRLQLLEPFPAWDGNDFVGLPVLMKAQGKCTTDHISAAGPWLKYRGHLENISGNLFLGVVNAFTGATGEGKDQLDGATRSFPDIAKHYSEAGIRRGARSATATTARARHASTRRWSRASAAAVAIFARSFARIHETNAKKQGLVPLTFADPATYDADRRGRPHQRARPASGAGPDRALPDRQARRHDRRLRVHAHVQRRAGRVVQGRLGPEHRPRQGRRRVLTPSRAEISDKHFELRHACDRTASRAVSPGGQQGTRMSTPTTNAGVVRGVGVGGVELVDRHAEAASHDPRRVAGSDRVGLRLRAVGARAPTRSRSLGAGRQRRGTRPSVASGS